MQNILETISSPKDIKRLSLHELEALALEIREFIIENVSRTGGHLASSLGTVELTLAMHYVFNAPHDKILWDVGHQAYPHKILTGRKDNFASLRQTGGVSAFINPKESPYDPFVSGHTGNAIPAASGICETMAKADCKNRVIAVIGDGSLSNGLTFEGLNFVGTNKQKLIVVLNDNKMFISPRVGAVADYLSRIMTSRKVREVKDEIKGLLKRIPLGGDTIYRVAKYIEGNLKGAVTEGTLFEELGFRYVGPIDGHRLDHLIQAFRNVSTMHEPIFLHVVTRKGNGYRPAMKDPEHFHGVGKFELENGDLKTEPNAVTYSDVFGRALVKIAKRDPRIVAISAAMTAGTGLKNFAARYPDRFFDVGIAEGHAVTMAAGMALYGLRPVVAIYSTFLQRSYDEIIHDVALQNAPVIFAVDRAGLVGADGPTHHGVFDLAYFRSIPNMTVLAPRDHLMLERMLVHAVRIQGPVAIRYPRDKIVASPLKPGNVKSGKAEVLREGTRLAVFCVGPLCYDVLEAVKRMDDIAVVDLVCAKPLDRETVCRIVEACRGRFIVVEDGCTQGGVGSAVVESLRDLAYPLRFDLLGLPDAFVEHGSLCDLKKFLGLDPEGIRKAINRLL
ncbi:MAG TPA: 1-deoxy-D-xylulose-5-phosphate synthase [Deltaproteobacteria bacterium]|jgi:1-deoxy-D-xylulose-5-phosphate synthase|nr:1-deoxy-D-xylulose-5-phosphate synthase [Deltaproteobacteria bacterium]